MISKFTKVAKLQNDLFAVFNSLLFKPFYVDSVSLEEILSESVADQDLVRELFNLGIYIESTAQDETAVERLVNFVESHSRQVNILYLIVSTYCNLACKYCFIDQHPLSVGCSEIMSIDIAKHAIDKYFVEIADRRKEHTQIILYGGEPLTNKPVIEFIIPYIRKIDHSIRITLITNATLLDDATIDILNEYDVGIGISIDGPKQVNDTYRIFKGNEASVHDVVIEKIQQLIAKHSKFGVSITISREVLNNKLTVLNWIKELGVKNVFWNLYHFSEKNDNWESFYTEMSDFIFDAYEVLNACQISEGRVDELIELFLGDSFRYQSCGALGLNQIAVLPNGSVCVCHGDSKKPDKSIGSIYSGSIASLVSGSSVDDWKGMYTINRKECVNCEAVFVCGGGCPIQAEALFGDRHQIDKASCIFYKKYLKWILEKYYYISKGETSI